MKTIFTGVYCLLQIPYFVARSSSLTSMSLKRNVDALKKIFDVMEILIKSMKSSMKPPHRAVWVE